MAFCSLQLEALIEELLCLNNSCMQSCQKILRPLQHVLVELTRVVARHALMPYVDDNQDVLDSHPLQKRQQFLAAAFLVAVIVSFCDIR